MKLPRADEAIVDEEKIRDYLLSPTHPVGKFKAAFFGGVLGYARDDWHELVSAFVRASSEGTVNPGKFSRFGNTYEVHATLAGPSGRSAQVVIVWIVRHGEEVPRFVTAMPGDPK